MARKEPPEELRIKYDTSGLPPASKADEWRKNSIVSAKVNGRRFTYIKPNAKVFVEAGVNPVVFNFTVPAKRRVEAYKESMGRKVSDWKKSEKFIEDILGSCLVEPRYWTGKTKDCPEDWLCSDYAGNDRGPMFTTIFQSAGFEQAAIGGAAGATFRQDRRRRNGSGDRDSLWDKTKRLFGR